MDLKDKGKRTPPEDDSENQNPRPQSQNGRREGTLLDSMRLDVEEAGGNPWRDSYQGTPIKADRRDLERAQRLRKKLSFDPATVSPFVVLADLPQLTLPPMPLAAGRHHASALG